MKLFDEISYFCTKNYWKIAILCLLIIPIGIFNYFMVNPSSQSTITNDAVGYYSYLPAVIIEQDLSFQFMIDQYSTEESSYVIGEMGDFSYDWSISSMYHEVKEGIFLNKYPIGVAVMLAPFFLVGHMFSSIFGLNLNGWGFFEQFFSFYGGIVYFLLGIGILIEIVKKKYKPRVVFCSVIVLVFGTNLLNYAAFENMFSHVYSFFLVSLLLYLTPQWYKDPTVRKSFLLGIAIGLIILVRQMNVVFALLFLLYGVTSWETFRKRVTLFLKKKQCVAIILFVVIALFLPQMIYWKYATGRWIVFSYVGETFDFTQLYLLKVLFSTQKGLFFWSPLLLLSVFGLLKLKGKFRTYVLPSSIIFIFQAFVIGSWWYWQYGGSYGHRAFTDNMGIFFLGFIGFYSWVEKKRLRVVMYAITIVLVFLSTFQMLQYWLRILPTEDITWEVYKSIFLNLDLEKSYWWLDQ